MTAVLKPSSTRPNAALRQAPPIGSTTQPSSVVEAPTPPEAPSTNSNASNPTPVTSRLEVPEADPK